MVLVDYLEDAAEYLRERTEKLRDLDSQYRRMYDRDLKREMGLVRQDIKKKKAQVTRELLVNLDEFRHLKKYYPDLLCAFTEDEYIGPIISKKAWLLDFKEMKTQQIVEEFQELKAKRAELKDARKFLRRWVGKVGAKAFVATYPPLAGYLEGDIEKDEVIEIIKKADKDLRRKGWLLLISDSLIEQPISKFLAKIRTYRNKELEDEVKLRQAKGRGTVAEANAKRTLEGTMRKKHHYENVLKQLLLANPSYLLSLKKKKDWLSRERKNALEKFVESVTPIRVKERAWLDEMRKRLSIDEELEKEPKKKKKSKRKKKSKKK
jgi:hypothetical protein